LDELVRSPAICEKPRPCQNAVVDGKRWGG